MTPKQKAEEIVNKFLLPVRWKMGQENVKERAKQCALIAVDEIIKSRKDDSQFDDTLWSGASDMYSTHPMYLKYWQEVKQEIEKL